MIDVKLVFDENVKFELREEEDFSGISVLSLSGREKVRIVIKEGKTIDDLIGVLDVLRETMEVDDSERGCECITIEDMEFSMRVYNCLKRAGINFKKDLENRTVGDLQRIRNMGRRGIDEIISRKDLKLKKDE